MKIFRIIGQSVIGFVFGLVSLAALSPFLASLPEQAGDYAGLGVAGFVALLSGFAPTVRRAFGRGFLVTGASVFALPLSTIILSGTVLAQTVSDTAVSDQGYAVAGGVIAGGMMTAAAGFIGFFFGTILLLTGLILSIGGRREVVVVKDLSSNRIEPVLAMSK